MYILLTILQGSLLQQQQHEEEEHMLTSQKIVAGAEARAFEKWQQAQEEWARVKRNVMAQVTAQTAHYKIPAPVLDTEALCNETDRPDMFLLWSFRLNRLVGPISAQLRARMVYMRGSVVECNKSSCIRSQAAFEKMSSFTHWSETAALSHGTA